MEKMKINQVIDEWLAAGQAESTRGSVSTDGSILYSYSLPIARYSWSDDRPIVFNYTAANGGTFVSATTSKHVNRVWQHLISKKYEPIMEDPPC